MVFELFKKNHQYTRTEIGRLTGISSPTVIKIFDYLSNMNLIMGVGEQDAPLGRKANLIRERYSLHL